MEQSKVIIGPDRIARMRSIYPNMDPVKLRPDYDPAQIGQRAFNYLSGRHVIDTRRGLIDLLALHDQFFNPGFGAQLFRQGLQLRHREHYDYRTVSASLHRIAEPEVLILRHSPEVHELMGEIIHCLRAGMKSVWSDSVRFLREKQGISMDMSGAVLRGYKLSGTYLEGVILNKAIFFGSELREVGFEHSLLVAADLRATDLSYSRFTAANMGEALLGPRRSFFESLIFHPDPAHPETAKLEGVDLSLSFLKGAIMPDGSVHP